MSTRNPLGSSRNDSRPGTRTLSGTGIKRERRLKPFHSSKASANVSSIMNATARPAAVPINIPIQVPTPTLQRVRSDSPDPIPRSPHRPDIRTAPAVLHAAGNQLAGLEHRGSRRGDGARKPHVDHVSALLDQKKAGILVVLPQRVITDACNRGGPHVRSSVEKTRVGHVEKELVVGCRGKTAACRELAELLALTRPDRLPHGSRGFG